MSRTNIIESMLVGLPNKQGSIVRSKCKMHVRPGEDYKNKNKNKMSRINQKPDIGRRSKVAEGEKRRRYNASLGMDLTKKKGFQESGPYREGQVNP